MKKMMTAWLFLCFLIFGTLYYIGFTYMQSVKDYRALENDLVESAQLYMDINKIALKFNEKLLIKGDTLLDETYINDMEVEEDTCEGYVVVKKGFTEYDYLPYIKCKDYTTVDYDKNN